LLLDVRRATSESRPYPTEEAAVSYTHYDYLELPHDASPARIEAAYLGLLERFGYGMTDAGQDMSNRVALIHAAYNILANPAARADYDATLAREAAMADAELKATLDQLNTGARYRAEDPPAWLDDPYAAIAA
jgi:DnaJ-class molecular chaperone